MDLQRQYISTRTATHEPKMKRDNIGTASKGERERENGNTFLCAARQAAARLAQEPHWRKSHCGLRRARTFDLQVKSMIYTLPTELGDPDIQGML